MTCHLVIVSALFRWHRGKLVRTTDKGWLVFFIDHGDEQEVDDDNNVLPLPDEFCALPAQAIHCSLAGIRPIGRLADNLRIVVVDTCSMHGQHVVGVSGVEYQGVMVLHNGCFCCIEFGSLWLC